MSSLHLFEAEPHPEPSPSPHSLFHGLASDVCKELESRGALLDLVYLDPPFNVGANFTARTRKGEARGKQIPTSGPLAYEDAWGGVDNFLEMLEESLCRIRERMSETALLWLHLDHRTVHDAKVRADSIFGRGAFRGEVIWLPGNGARGKSGPSITHQTLLVYSRDDSPKGNFTWNADDPMLREPYAETSQRMHFRHRDEAGRLYRERVVNGKAYRYYADEGRRLGSVWSDAPAMVANTPLRQEATGYPTQKPEKLLERIVRASSREGDTVADLMCGSGTTLVVAARLGRKFIGGDASPLAIEITKKRLDGANIDYEYLGSARD